MGLGDQLRHWMEIVGSDPAVELTNNVLVIANAASDIFLIARCAIRINIPNTIEKFENNVYTRQADEHLDLDSVLKWVLEFIDHPSFNRGMNVLWDAMEITTTSLNFSDMAHVRRFPT
jgi:hypothetical protein